MKVAAHGKRTARFILAQLGASALVLAVLFMIPISVLIEQQVREGEAADAIASQTQLLQEMSRLAETVVHGGGAPTQFDRMRMLVHEAKANEARLAAGLPDAMRRQLARDLAQYTAAALALRGHASSVAAYHEMIDVQIDLVQRLANTERLHLERTHSQSNWVYVMVGCALVALLMLLVSGWRSLLNASKKEALLLERVADAGEDDARLTRMEDLYLIVASSGVDPARQTERALAYASTTLGFEWSVAIEWLDGEEPVVTASSGIERFDAPHALGFALEKAIARESSRAGSPVTFRIDRLPPDLAPLAVGPRAFPWRHCAAYTFPGDFKERTPHCAVFLASQQQPAELSEADKQLLRLIGTLVSSSSRSARHQKRLDGLAFADPLTGMPNRALLQEQLEQRIAVAAATNTSFAIHYIDLDGFKKVNDEDGHEVGDEVLKIAATRMGKVLRAGETVARIGGDEFVVLQQDIANPVEAREVAERLIEHVARPLIIEGRKHRIGCSVGIALYPAHGRTSSELLRHADSALYQSKRNGKGRASFYAAPSGPGSSEVVVA
jgi:diguanylate cyclase (GGDEF)-like protein